jgi:hypothetical protein
MAENGNERVDSHAAGYEDQAVDGLGWDGESRWRVSETASYAD